MQTAAPLRLGTRASPLARWQAEWVAGELAARGQPVELVPITTTGDVAAGPLAALGGVGVFTKELQRALLDGRIDLAVHSLKDLPTDEVANLVLAAVPVRENTADVLLSHSGLTLDRLPRAARVATGSLRRRAQLLHLRPDLQLVDVRGNVDTRLRKLAEKQFDAMILAAAGLSRLGLTGQITQVLSHAQMLPAVGQGALGIETRGDDAAARTAVAALNDPASFAAVTAEREMLRTLCAGCLAPVGGLCRMEAAGEMVLKAVVLSFDGKEKLTAEERGAADDPETLGRRVAQSLLAQGAGELVRQARERPIS